MSIKIYLTLSLAIVCNGTAAQDSKHLDTKMVNDCRAVAKALNESHKLGIRMDDLTPYVTWRAACAERPPAGLGEVTALCEGKRTSANGNEKLFFWQKKSKVGKLNNGYFICSN
jgi:hypothetical protein